MSVELPSEIMSMASNNTIGSFFKAAADQFSKGMGFVAGHGLAVYEIVEKTGAALPALISSFSSALPAIATHGLVPAVAGLATGGAGTAALVTALAAGETALLIREVAKEISKRNKEKALAKDAKTAAARKEQADNDAPLGEIALHAALPSAPLAANDTPIRSDNRLNAMLTTALRA